ncbi:MAG: ABC transporter ATP-binding protein [Nanoarchaeota archaeon]
MTEQRGTIELVSRPITNQTSTLAYPTDDQRDDPIRDLESQGWPRSVIEKFMARAVLAKGPLLSIDSLGRSYGKKKVVEGFSINIFQGEIFGIVGVSGSGKTTLIETIAGVTRPNKGQVLLKDPKTGDMKSVHKDPSLRWWIGYSPQVPSVYPELTLRENLESFSNLMEIPAVRIKTRLDQLSMMLDLGQVMEQRVGTLSKGWQKKADIACAIINEPTLLILDEPGRDLDPIARRAVYRAIRNVNAAGTTVVLSSHAISELSELCTRIGVLHDGMLQRSVKPQDVGRAFYEVKLKTDTGLYGPYVERLSQAAIPATCNSAYLRVRTTEPELVIRFLLDSTSALKESILDLEVTRPNVSDLFEGWVRQ